MILMEQTFELEIGESPRTRYVVEQQLADGRVVLRPQTELEAMRERAGSRALTPDEFDELIAPHLLPADGEG
jgi:hypothetical protein